VLFLESRSLWQNSGHRLSHFIIMYGSVALCCRCHSFATGEGADAGMLRSGIDGRNHRRARAVKVAGRYLRSWCSCFV
jgi:hypothetical protein